MAAAQTPNAARPEGTRVPDVGFFATLGTLRRPSRADGFDAVVAVELDGRGGFRLR